MGTYVNNGIVLIPNEHRFGEAPDILSELGGLLGVGKRSDGKYHHADMNQADSINILSKYKPTDSKDVVHTSTSHKGDGTQNGYFWGYNCYGVTKPYVASSQFNVLGANGTPATSGQKITGFNFTNLVGDWSKSAIVHNRIRDFDGYIHTPQPNNILNGSQQFSASFQCTNPNGAIAATATLRYNWEDVVHSNGKSATLGLKSLLACDGTNTKAYLGVAAYRTLTKTGGTNKTLVPIGVAKIHSAPLGTRCPNTGEINTHHVNFSVDDLIVGTEGNVTNGYTDFYYGETGITCIPFIAKWTGSVWCLIGLGVTPYVMSGALITTGGSGSTTNTVAITRVVATLTAVKNTDGTITVGLQGNTAFQVTVSGSGFLAFQADNVFYITPADGNSTLQSQTGVRLGTSIDSELDLPGTTVSAGTYQASSLMSGRSSSATYQNPPSSKFKPYSNSTPFKVGIQVVYYKGLKTWTYLTGNVEINPSDITTGNSKTYTITITGA